MYIMYITVRSASLSVWSELNRTSLEVEYTTVGATQSIVRVYWHVDIRSLMTSYDMVNEMSDCSSCRVKSKDATVTGKQVSPEFGQASMILYIVCF